MRSHTCGELHRENQGQRVTLCGWVSSARNHGGILFVDLRDRYGVTQITFDPEAGGTPPEILEQASRLGNEDVIRVQGRVALRAEGQNNPNRCTGEIEVFADQLELLSKSEPSPIDLSEKNETSIETRLRYRYLDLRRPSLLQGLAFRSKFCHALREHLLGQDFIEVETPILTRTTPEGARDYLVPSRIHSNKFYALPQSPQIFKQLLMVGGVDRYFQIARCFRDEDLRADRQPEFTQLDLEMSFVEEEDVLQVVEAAVVHAFKRCLGIDLKTPFPRLRHEEAMERFGNDKPDLRFGLELVDLSALVARTEFKVFTSALEAGGCVKAIPVPEGADLSRKEIQGLEEVAKEYGARGLAWCKLGDEGLSGPVAKFFAGDLQEELIERTGLKPGGLLLFGAGDRTMVLRSLAEVRNALGKKLGLTPEGEFAFAWVTHFPLFEWNEEKQRFEFSHHPFTAPEDWDVDFSKDTEKVASRAYDLVLNGWELGSGSIRIHRQDVQQRIFEFLGMSPEEAQEKFGFLLNAFRYGAPPHGGFAFGIDRIVTLALGLDSIRDVIAFPKTASAACLMTDAPSPADPAQLEELKIRLIPKKEEAQA
ncbi:MAG TPA: aspartate--tRNA ligase [Planctomycetes bacterium]|nr:aspartate--tRNA ligase [Planctomycetota bacterium]